MESTARTIRIPLQPNGAPNRSAYVWRNWEADGDFTLALATAPEGWLTDSEGKINTATSKPATIVNGKPIASKRTGSE